MAFESWGNFPKIQRQLAVSFEPGLQFIDGRSYLPRGLGRSYGDSCLLEGGTLLLSTEMDCLVSFDEASGLLTCQSGVSLSEILRVFVPKGWFLPVTPGTSFVTVGGGIANDVHGKNHHIAGSFGHFVRSFRLLRSDGKILNCSESENSDYFYATIGGLGLTGFILEASIELKKINSTQIRQIQTKFYSLKEYLVLANEFKSQEYTVAWFDSVSGADLRGIFIAGEHFEEGGIVSHRESRFSVPMFFPDLALNPVSMKVFNEFYFHKNLRKRAESVCHYGPFFYPLDAVANWNRIYGRRGFLQYQFVVPANEEGAEACDAILRKIKSAGLGSFLSVLKSFGPKRSLGLLSFPREGLTLAMDFPNSGNELFKILEQCDQVILEVGGALYPAKDARMSKKSFEKSFPRLEEFLTYKDPAMSSSFWERVMK